jgi:hypothetical protein
MQYLFSFLAVLFLIQVNSSIIDRFHDWFNQYNIPFRDEQHLAHIFDNWLSNEKFIQESNTQNHSYTLGHNAYSGMSTEEFGEFMGFISNQNGYLRGSSPTVLQDEIFNVSALPTSIDWRTKNAVTPVKNQGNCGSCYSFSSTGALEGIYSIKTGKLVSFSEQQIVDCDNGLTKAHGCNGGIMDQVFSYISSNGGLCSEQTYPYVSGTTQKAGTCQTSCPLITGSKISKYTDVIPNSDNAMMTALSQQPVSVAIEADQREFQLYKSGVFTGSCGANLDHGVLLVGYGSQNNQDYYILKNSWDVTWGQSGYILLARGNDPSTNKPYNNGAGQCGVLSQGSYPSL